eukprot:SAG31_NODE_1790_length_7264_cov_3.356455_3_plen_122_part_00
MKGHAGGRGGRALRRGPHNLELGDLWSDLPTTAVGLASRLRSWVPGRPRGGGGYSRTKFSTVRTRTTVLGQLSYFFFYKIDFLLILLQLLNLVSNIIKVLNLVEYAKIYLPEGITVLVDLF